MPAPRPIRRPARAATPIYQTTAYVFDDVDHAASLFNLQTYGYIYSRLTNPTVSVLEERVATLEGGRGAIAVASGHAAQMLAFFSFMEPGDQFVASSKLYGGSITQFGRSFKKFGWNAIFVDADDPENFRRALTPQMQGDLRREPVQSRRRHRRPRGASPRSRTRPALLFIVDNTMASPWLCRPIDWGADLVVHSTTKFLSGHGNAMGGASSTAAASTGRRTTSSNR